MNTPDFLKILRNPKQLQNHQVFEIEDILRNFPYFQAARAVYLKGLKIHNSFRYNQELKIAAAYTTDRSVLFDFITSDDFNLIHNRESQHFIAEIEAVDQKVKHRIEAHSGTQNATPDKENTLTENSLLPTAKTTNPDTILPEKTEDAIYVNPEISQKHPATNNGENTAPENTESSQKTPDNDTVVEKKSEVKKPESSEIFFEIDTENEIEETGILDIEKHPAEKVDLLFEPVHKEEKEENSEWEKTVDAPFNFTKEDTFSFKEWLQLSNLKPIDRSDNTKATDHGLERKMHLIDTFIENNPKIKPAKSAPEPVASNTEEPHDEIDESHVMTETLARVYTKQKKYDSAIKAYEILSLKFPKKSSFFADQIKKLKKLKQKHKNI